jgi:hypothetical protein
MYHQQPITLAGPRTQAGRDVQYQQGVDPFPHTDQGKHVGREAHITCREREGT